MRLRIAFTTLVLILAAGTALAKSSPAHDIVIRNGRLIDGFENPIYDRGVRVGVNAPEVAR